MVKVESLNEKKPKVFTWGGRNASGFYHHSLWGKRMIYINYEGVNTIYYLLQLLL